jgi:hypothetical protein
MRDEHVPSHTQRSDGFSRLPFANYLKTVDQLALGRSNAEQPDLEE